MLMSGDSCKYMLMRDSAWSTVLDDLLAHLRFTERRINARLRVLTCPNILECSQSRFSLSQTSPLEFLPPIFSTRVSGSPCICEPPHHFSPHPVDVTQWQLIIEGILYRRRKNSHNFWRRNAQFSKRSTCVACESKVCLYRYLPVHSLKSPFCHRCRSVIVRGSERNNAWRKERSKSGTWALDSQ